MGIRLIYYCVKNKEVKLQKNRRTDILPGLYCRNNPKYWDTLTPCHNCPKIWKKKKGLFYCQLIDVSKTVLEEWQTV